MSSLPISASATLRRHRRAQVPPLYAPRRNIGIVRMDAYFPAYFVSLTDLETYDGVASGKYTIGLGLRNMAVCSDREDINSMCLTAVRNFMRKYRIPYESIGRLAVGTESMVDKAKSVKSVLMTLFESSGNVSPEGVDTINACYGGTAALFDTIAWIESSSWDGRWGLVVSGDIAVYERGPARATGGAGIIVMLIGPDAPLVLQPLRASHFEHAFDFYKPKMSSEYPVVDGKLSIDCYLRALFSCRSQLVHKVLSHMEVALNEPKAPAPQRSAASSSSSDAPDVAASEPPHAVWPREAGTRLAAASFTERIFASTVRRVDLSSRSASLIAASSTPPDWASATATSGAPATASAFMLPPPPILSLQHHHRAGAEVLLQHADYACFHTPFVKLAVRAYAALATQDALAFARDPELTASLPQHRAQGVLAVLEILAKYASGHATTDALQLPPPVLRRVESLLMEHPDSSYQVMTEPSLNLAKELGNLYCGSLYAAILSLVCSDSAPKEGQSVMCFSYGSGLASSLFVLTATCDTAGVVADRCELEHRLSRRVRVAPAEFHKMLAERELVAPGCVLSNSALAHMFPGTYFLAAYDEHQRRQYSRTLDAKL